MALDTNWITPRRWMGKSCYRVEDVETLLASVHEELDRYADLEQKLERITRENSDISLACAQRQEENARLTEQLQSAQQELSRKSRAAAETEANLKEQIVDLQDMLERARKREEFLNANIEQQKQEIADFEKFAASDPVKEAQQKSQKIVADAMAERERILQEYAQQRARVTAATRSAYYSALQFKMSMVKRFGDMEKNLDESIDILRTLESSSSNGTPMLDERVPASLEESRMPEDSAEVLSENG